MNNINDIKLNIEVNAYRHDLLDYLPEGYLLISIFLLIIYVLTNVYQNKFNKISLYDISWITIIILVFTIILLVQNIGADTLIINNMVNTNYFLSILKVVSLLTTIACILLSFNYLQYSNLYKFEYLIFLLIAGFGLITILVGENLVFLFLAIEILSLIFYVLTTLKRKSVLSTEAGLKYFIYGSFSSSFLLFGISIIFGFLGTVNLSDLLHILSIFDTYYINTWLKYLISSYNVIILTFIDSLITFQLFKANELDDLFFLYNRVSSYNLYELYTLIKIGTTLPYLQPAESMDAVKAVTTASMNPIHELISFNVGKPWLSIYNTYTSISTVLDNTSKIAIQKLPLTPQADVPLKLVYLKMYNISYNLELLKLTNNNIITLKLISKTLNCFLDKYLEQGIALLKLKIFFLKIKNLSIFKAIQYLSFYSIKYIKINIDKINIFNINIKLTKVYAFINEFKLFLTNKNKNFFVNSNPILDALQLQLNKLFIKVNLLNNQYITLRQVNNILLLNMNVEDNQNILRYINLIYTNYLNNSFSTSNNLQLEYLKLPIVSKAYAQNQGIFNSMVINAYINNINYRDHSTVNSTSAFYFDNANLIKKYLLTSFLQNNIFVGMLDMLTSYIYELKTAYELKSYKYDIRLYTLFHIETANFDIFEILSNTLFLFKSFTYVLIYLFNPIGLGVLFIFIGLLFKLGAVPFHMWLPDVYEGSPTIITAYFAITPKLIILTLLIRLCNLNFNSIIFYWQQLIIVSALLSLIFGTIMALYQYNIKRFIAYSTITHLGYMLLGLVINTQFGIQSVIFYMLVYIIMNIGLFSFILALYNKIKLTRSEYLTHLNGLAYSNPILALTLVVFFFSFAGIPPLIGFYSKFYIFLVTMYAVMPLLTTIGLLASVIGSIYYIRVIKILFFEKPYNWSYYSPITTESAVLLILVLYIVLFFCYDPNLFFFFIHNMTFTLSWL